MRILEIRDYLTFVSAFFALVMNQSIALRTRSYVRIRMIPSLLKYGMTDRTTLLRLTGRFRPGHMSQRFFVDLCVAIAAIAANKDSLSGLGAGGKGLG